MTIQQPATMRQAAVAIPDPGAAPVPLVVDVDGTLIVSDFLHESALRLAAERPFTAALIPFWLVGGRARLKAHINDHVGILSDIPLRRSVVDLIQAAKAEGRPVYLASASDHRQVQALADRIGVIDGVFATTAGRNLAGSAKAETLVEAFGQGGYDYVADADVDFPVWRSARRVLVVTHGAAFEKRVLAAFPEATVVDRTRRSAGPYLRVLRVHQWAKNALVFLPLILNHSYADIGQVLAAMLAFVCFSFAASSAYALNDLLDLPADRKHPTKHRRPFAAGAVAVSHGVVMSAMLILSAFAIGLLALPLGFLAVLGAYFVATVTYSLILKRKVFVDVVVLGGLYAVRVLGGAAAIGAPGSNWLLMLCLFLFLCLAIAKRYTELAAKEAAGGPPPSGRGYRFEDMRVLLPLAAASGYMSVLVVALYMNSEQVTVLYSNPDVLWLTCVIQLYWVSRVLILANRGELHEDPVVFALRDRISWLCALGVLTLVVVAV